MHFITSLLQSCKAVYDRIIDLKISTPQIIINYALFLEEHKYFEEAFRVSGHGYMFLYVKAHLYTEDGGNIFLFDVGGHLPYCFVSWPGRLLCILTIWKSGILCKNV